jgi:hypothetical protein
VKLKEATALQRDDTLWELTEIRDNSILSYCPTVFTTASQTERFNRIIEKRHIGD